MPADTFSGLKCPTALRRRLELEFSLVASEMEIKIKEDEREGEKWNGVAG